MLNQNGSAWRTATFQHLYASRASTCIYTSQLNTCWSLLFHWLIYLGLTKGLEYQKEVCYSVQYYWLATLDTERVMLTHLWCTVSGKSKSWILIVESRNYGITYSWWCRKFQSCLQYESLKLKLETSRQCSVLLFYLLHSFLHLAK